MRRVAWLLPAILLGSSVGCETSGGDGPGIGEFAWNKEQLAVGYGVGQDCVLAIDPDGALHASYRSGADLSYATTAGGGWFAIDLGDDKIGGHSSVAARAADDVHIVHSDSLDDGYLGHLDNRSGDWVHEVVVEGGFPGEQGISLVLDDADALHVAFFMIATEVLHYATNATGDWVVEPIDEDGEVGRHVAMAMDGSGTLHAVYTDSLAPGLKHATQSGDSWETELACSTSDSLWSVNLAVSPDDRLHATWTTNLSEEMGYAVFDGASWSCEVLAEGASDSSVAVDDAGVVHLTRSVGGLSYGNDATGSWEWETLDETSEDDGYYAGGYSDMVVDAAGSPHIIWFANDLAAQNGKLWYATPND